MGLGGQTWSASATHRGENLQIGFWLGTQGIFYPLAILVKHPSDDLTAALELTPPDLLQLRGGADFALLHLRRLQGRLELVGFEIHHGAMAQADAGIVRQDAAALTLDGEQGGVEQLCYSEPQVVTGAVDHAAGAV